MKFLLPVLRSFCTVSYLATSNRCLGEPLLTGSFELLIQCSTHRQILADLAQKQLLKFSAGRAESRLDMVRKKKTWDEGRGEGRESGATLGKWSCLPSRVPFPAANSQVLFIAPLTEPSAQACWGKLGFTWKHLLWENQGVIKGKEEFIPSQSDF